MDKLLKKKLFVVMDVLCVFVGKLWTQTTYYVNMIFYPVVVVTAVFLSVARIHKKWEFCIVCLSACENNNNASSSHRKRYSIPVSL